MADTNEDLTAASKKAKATKGMDEPIPNAADSGAASETGSSATQPNRVLFGVGWGLGRTVRALKNGVTWLGRSSGDAVTSGAKAIGGGLGRRKKTQQSSTDAATEGGIDMDFDVAGIPATASTTETTADAAESAAGAGGGIEMDMDVDGIPATASTTEATEDTEEKAPTGAKAKKK